MSLYFLSPILLFWGLTREPINSEFIKAPFIYLIVIFITLFILYFYSLKIFKGEPQDRSIFLASSLVGNTGNLGIPLGIALFGIQSVPYTSIINIANVFYLYIFSVYFFAGDKFKFIDAIKEILKIPAIYASILALLYNYLGFVLNTDFDKLFTMGAYAAIVIQLIIFGIFIAQVKVKSANWKLALNISLFKHIILPLIGIYVVLLFEIDPMIAGVIFLELAVPLAVNNINLSSLYNCKPIDTTFAVLVGCAIFVLMMYFYILVMKYFFGL